MRRVSMALTAHIVKTDVLHFGLSRLAEVISTHITRLKYVHCNVMIVNEEI